ncbi:MAG TPA: hypothetical protein VGC57_16080 [Cellulomonas sp.]
MSAKIQPPFRLYTLQVRTARMGSPSQPVVMIVQEDLFDGQRIDQHSLTPEQARLLAADLVAAADPVAPVPGGAA